MIGASPSALALALGVAVTLLPAKAVAAPAPEGEFTTRARGWGVGLSVGDPLGASVKYFLHPNHALQGQVGYGLLHNGDGIVSFEYLWHSDPIGESPIVDVLGYVGLGIGLGFWATASPNALELYGRDSGAGAAMMVRAPVLGLAFHWVGKPIDTALELSWAPYLIMPELRFIDASIKLRYFF
jgi:hypothetical protein